MLRYRGVITLLLFFHLANAASVDLLQIKLEEKFSVTAENIDAKIFEKTNRHLWLEVVEKIEYPQKRKKLQNRPFPSPELAKNLPDLYVKKISTPAALYIAQLSEKPDRERAVKDFLKTSKALVKEESTFLSLFESACRDRADFQLNRAENALARITVVKIREACLPVYYADFSNAIAINFFDQKIQRLILEGESVKSARGNRCLLDPPPPSKFAESKILTHDVAIAIIDSGVDYNHFGLVDAIQFSQQSTDEIQSILRNRLDDFSSEGFKKSLSRFFAQPGRLKGMGWDFLLNSNFPMDYFENQTNSEGWMNIGAGHGTHVAGLAWGENARFSILPIRMIGNSKVRFEGKEVPKDAYAIAYDSIALASLRKARVASISMEGFSERGQGFTDAIQDHPELFVVAAAGNGGIEITKFAIPLQSYLAPNLIRVAGLNANEDAIHKESNFSNTYVDLAVASENILSCTVGGESGRMTGTSMAAPRVANLAATLFSINPELRAEEVKEILCNTADQSEKLKSMVRCGKMNAKRAIDLVLQKMKK